MPNNCHPVESRSLRRSGFASRLTGQEVPDANGLRVVIAETLLETAIDIPKNTGFPFEPQAQAVARRAFTVPPIRKR